jgi:hypothetical protein
MCWLSKGRVVVFRSLCLALAVAAVVAPAATAGGPPPEADSRHRELQTVWVKVDCRLLKERRVDDCRVVNERPAGRGFGEHVLQMFSRPSYRVPLEHSKKAVDGRIAFDVPLTAVSGPTGRP